MENKRIHEMGERKGGNYHWRNVITMEEDGREDQAQRGRLRLNENSQDIYLVFILSDISIEFKLCVK